MAEKILVTPQALESAEIRMRAASAEFAKSVSCCNTAMNNLGSAWRDEMFAVANGRYEETIKGLLDDVPEVLNAYADMIEDSLRAFEGIDEELKNEIWGMEFMAALALLPPVTTPLGELLNKSDEQSLSTPLDNTSGSANRLNSDEFTLHDLQHYIDTYRDKPNGREIPIVINGETQLNDDGTKKLRDETYGENCKRFVNQVMKDNGKSVPGMGDGVGGPPKNGYPMYELVGHPSNRIKEGIVYSDDSREIANRIENLFEGAKKGDVVQMVWTNGGFGPHTMIYIGADDAGNLGFLHSNAPPGNVRIDYFSPDKLAGWLGVDGCGLNVYSF